MESVRCGDSVEHDMHAEWQIAVSLGQGQWLVSVSLCADGVMLSSLDLGLESCQQCL